MFRKVNESRSDGTQKSTTPKERGEGGKEARSKEKKRVRKLNHFEINSCKKERNRTDISILSKEKEKKGLK